MNNTLRARLDFSFKAETFKLDTQIDLDRCLGDAGVEPNFHLLLAKAGGIDPYSYLYEAMEVCEITFSDPTGIAALSCCDGQFDWSQFEQHVREDRGVQVVRAIAEQILGVRDLDLQVDLKAALLATYQAGRAAAD
jgi:hypothetical protein